MENEFLNSIKTDCMAQMKKNNILASIIGAIAYYHSNGGQNEMLPATSNLYKLRADDKWTGKCFGFESKSLYDSYRDGVGSKDDLYRVYGSYTECIEDWVNYILNRRKGESGPYRYRNIIGLSSYKKVANMLDRDGYSKDITHRKDSNFNTAIVSIIDKYDLVRWDLNTFAEKAIPGDQFSVKKFSGASETLITTDYLEGAKAISAQNQGYKVYDSKGNEVFDPWTHAESDPIYRVRIAWEAIESQLLSTQSYEDAVREASEHRGYKVYVGDLGDIAFDPWKKKKPANKVVLRGPKKPVVKQVINLYPGMPIKLSKSTALYKNAVDNIPIKFITGDFYVYSTRVIRNRIRITNIANVDRYEGNTSIILGMIELPRN